MACTRAKDLLVFPRHAWGQASSNSWVNAVDLRLDELPAMTAGEFNAVRMETGEESENAQTARIFRQQAERIVGGTTKISWLNPSRHEDDRPETVAETPSSEEGMVREAPAIQGSALRGSILHKLMEEVLLENMAESPSLVEERARELIIQWRMEPAKGLCLQ